MKVAIINGHGGYHALFEKYGFTLADAPTRDTDLIVFTGGEDVSPHLYKHPAHPSTFFSLRRDSVESTIFQHAQFQGTPCVGICRGGQFLNVMSGGEMYQDVTKHTRDHLITDATSGFEVLVTSTHHQMMKPSSEAVLVASSALGGRRTY